MAYIRDVITITVDRLDVKDVVRFEKIRNKYGMHKSAMWKHIILCGLKRAEKMCARGTSFIDTRDPNWVPDYKLKMKPEALTIDSIEDDTIDSEED